VPATAGMEKRVSSESGAWQPASAWRRFRYMTVGCADSRSRRTAQCCHASMATASLRFGTRTAAKDVIACRRIAGSNLLLPPPTPIGSSLSTRPGSLKVWDLCNGKLVFAALAHRGAARSVALSFDGSMLATAGAEGTLRIWDTAGESVTAIRVDGALYQCSWLGATGLWAIGSRGMYQFAFVS